MTTRAQPLLVEREGRVLRFMLRPGQSIRGQSAPPMPTYVIVLRGHGLLARKHGEERPFGPGDLVIFDRSEGDAIRALEELLFVSFLQQAPRSHRERVRGLRCGAWPARRARRSTL